MKLTPIKRDQIAAGRPTRWTLYNASGKVILKAGGTLKSAEQITSLLKIGAFRDLDEPVAATEPGSAASRSKALTLEQVKLNIGDPLQLQFQSESEQSRCFVTLIGYLADQGVIVSTPVLNGSVMLIREGQIFVVRLFSGKSAYGFTATTMKVTNSPFPHLHLSYPKELRGLVVRGSSRARANIICHGSNVNGTGFACVARDISIGGALIAVKEKIGEVGNTLSLKLRVKINDAEHVLILDCQIRSCNVSKSSTDETPTILHGLSFEKISAQDTLVISALLYQNMVNEKNSKD